MKKIVLLDDIFRKDFMPARKFIYSLIQEPIRQASEYEIPTVNISDIHRGLNKKFNGDVFVNLNPSPHWYINYHEINEAARDYLLSAMPGDSLVVGYEMPPWLIKTLDGCNCPRIDIRISPLRFSRDLYFDIFTTMPMNGSETKIPHVTDNELRLEASLMRASIIHNLSRRNLKGGIAQKVVFIGQSEKDASKILPSEGFAKVEKFAEEIKDFVTDFEVVYKAHPYAKAFAKRERKILEDIVGKRVRASIENIYNILCQEEEYKILTISSGVHKESRYFQCDSKALFEPWIYKRIVGKNISEKKITVRAEHFLSPRLWGMLLNSERQAIDLPLAAPNLARRLHNVWWGYADYYIDNDSFWGHSLKRTLKNIIKDFYFSLKNKMRL